MSKTTIAMVLGDPAGIGPELIARLLAEPQVRSQANVILIADEAEMRRGMRIAGVEFPYRRVESLDQLSFVDDTPLFYDFRGDTIGECRAVKPASSAAATASTLWKKPCVSTEAGTTGAVLFGPLNKTSLHMAGMAHKTSCTGSPSCWISTGRSANSTCSTTSGHRG